MNTPIERRRLFVSGCIISLLVLAIALYSEAVDAVAAFDFNTPVQWDAFRASMSHVKVEHFNLEAHDALALVGMLVILLCAISPKANISKLALIGYSVVYLATGGFIGLAAIAFGWFLAPIDGEFFQDRTASFLAHGVWGYTLVIFVIHTLAVRMKTAEQGACTQPSVAKAPSGG